MRYAIFKLANGNKKHVAVWPSHALPVESTPVATTIISEGTQQLVAGAFIDVVNELQRCADDRRDTAESVTLILTLP